VFLRTDLAPWLILLVKKLLATYLVRVQVHRISKVKVLAGVLWHPVTEGNCVAARRGGEQPEVNDESVTRGNSIRPTVVASPLGNGEARLTHGPQRAATDMWPGKPDAKNPRDAPGRR
jgi:hypothetical protein